LSFFEKAWASRRTELSVFDVIPILELVRAQPFNKVYPSDLHVIGDWANAVRRSIHAYDVVPIRDYAYASRGNVVHAYDIIQQPDTATRSGNVTLSVTDILSIPEWFFRVNKALKIFEGYIPYELATVSAIPAIFAKDLSIVYDLGASINAIKTASAFDKLITDYVTYTKSYSPLFFTLLRRRVPIVYKTLSVLDTVAISERVDYVKSYSPLFFTMFQRKVPIVYKTLSISDIVDVKDSASVVQIKAYTVHVSDFIMYDYVPSMSTSDVKYRSLYANVGMRTISVLDRITPYESVWVGPRVITVNARDYLVSDGAAIVKRSVHAYDVVGVWENVNIVRL